MVACSRCSAGTGRVHGHHERTAADVPVDGRRVVVTARLRRLRCPVLGYRVRTSREQVSGVMASYQRRTARAAVARELAAVPLPRLPLALGIRASRDKALRACSGSRFPSPDPQVLGIDDFALRRSLVYATVLIDAGIGRRVDVIPGRSTDAAGDWLPKHPGGEVVCRNAVGVLWRGRPAGPAVGSAGQRQLAPIARPRRGRDALRLLRERHASAGGQAARDHPGTVQQVHDL